MARSSGSIMSLHLPTDRTSNGREVGTSTSPRRAVSPLLEVRRPHCTLNCDHCNAILEDRFKHLSKHICITYQLQFYLILSVFHKQYSLFQMYSHCNSSN